MAPIAGLEDRPGLLHVAILTGGGDRPYALGLASSLIAQGVGFDFIGSDEVDGPELHDSPLVRFLNLRGEQASNVTIYRKVIRVVGEITAGVYRSVLERRMSKKNATLR